MFLGASSLPLLLYAGSILLRLPLTWSGWTIMALAALGLVRLVRRNKNNPKKMTRQLLHPAFVLPIMIFIISALQPALYYTPLNWDEFSSWINWGRQIYAGDTWWRDDIIAHYRFYTPAWPMVQVFAQTPFDEIDDIRSIAYLTLFHVALLALLFDTVRLVLSKETTLRKHDIDALSWTVLLLLVLGEASWKLIPPSLLIERVTLYWALGFFLLALRAWYCKKSRKIMPWALGLIVGSLFTLKTPMASLAIPAMIFGLWVWWEDQKEKNSKAPSLIFTLTAIALPYLIVYGTWYSIGGGVIHSPSQAPLVQWESVGELTIRIASELMAYISAYKWPLTIIGLTGLLTGALTPKQKPLVIGLTIFIVCYWLGLLPVYLYVIGGNVVEELPSLPRYSRLCLRLVHFLGGALLLINMIRVVVRALPTQVMRMRLLPISFGLVAIMLLTVQGWATNRTLTDMRTRERETPELVAAIFQIKKEATQLKILIKELEFKEPRVFIIDQNDVGFRHRVASYHSVNTRRGEPIYAYRLLSWWSYKTKEEESGTRAFLKDLQDGIIIWPVHLNSWLASVLSTKVDTADCRDNLLNYFILIHEGKNFTCYAKQRE